MRTLNTHPIRLTRSLALSSTKSANIWPTSAALPCEYRSVAVARGFLMYTATISFPFRVRSFKMSTPSALDDDENSGIFRPPATPSSVISWYDGGFGGKKANLAAMDDVTKPISSSSGAGGRGD